MNETATFLPAENIVPGDRLINRTRFDVTAHEVIEVWGGDQITIETLNSLGQTIQRHFRSVTPVEVIAADADR
tara:strand:+ start:21109 stop:21327 length:219 start_codon:yes stop_codon:yes gene_type:complete